MTGRTSPPTSNPTRAVESAAAASQQLAQRRRFVFFCTLGGLLLYALTCAPGVVWQDSGIFQYRVWRWDLEGVIGLPLAHPWYIILARLFAYLPLGEFAYRVNLFSALCGALALGFMADLLLSLTRNRFAATCGVILLGVSHTFWTHSVIAEVYTLYAVGLAAELWLIERFFSRRQFGWLLAAALVNGLNLSNHLMAILHWPAYAGVILWALRARRLAALQVLMLLAAVFVGSTPYLYLIIRRLLHGQGLAEALKEALVGPPHRAEVVLTHAFPFARQTIRAAQYFLLNFPTPLLLLAPVGLWAALRDASQRWFALIGSAVFVVGFVFAYRYLVPDQYVFYFPCYILMAMFTALGVAKGLQHPGGARLRWVCVVAAAFPALVYEAAPPILRAGNINFGVSRELPYRDSYVYFLRPRKNGDDGAGRFLRESLAQAAPDGAVMADSTILNPLVYVRDVEGVHPGVAIGVPANVSPLPPVVIATAEQWRPFVERGRAFALTEAKFMSRWVGETYDFEPAGSIYILREKRATPTNPEIP